MTYVVTEAAVAAREFGNVALCLDVLIAQLRRRDGDARRDRSSARPRERFNPVAQSGY
jgi:hypothetical protein